MQPKSSSDPPPPAPEGEDTWVGARASSEPPATVPPVSSVQDIELGRLIDGRFRVDALLGKGAVGLVYQCRHLVLDKDVAIKVLRPDYAEDPEVARRLEVEAKAASAVGSPHIVETLDFGALPDGSAYFVMEYLEGQTLGQLLESGHALSAPELLHIATQIAEALDDAHVAGIVHRDLKPDNVFLVQRATDPYFVKILDFGIAKLARAESKLTRAGHIYGTPHYMSPEQATGQSTDYRTDIYSVGVILYELVTSKVPFDAEEPMAILMQHVQAEPPAMLPAAGGDLVFRLEAVVLKCLQKDPNARYQSMAELRADLQRLASGAVPQAVSMPPEQRTSSLPPSEPSSLLTRGVYAIASVGVLASLSLGYALYRTQKHAPPPAMPSSAVPSEAEAVPEPEAPPPEATEQEEETKAGKPVLLIVLPADARITQGGKDLGAMPVTVHVPKGGRAELLLEHPGYVSRRVILKGDVPKVVVGMVPVTRASKGAQAEAEADAEAEAKAQARRVEVEQASSDTEGALPRSLPTAEGAGDFAESTTETTPAAEAAPERAAEKEPGASAPPSEPESPAREEAAPAPGAPDSGDSPTPRNAPSPEEDAPPAREQSARASDGD